MNWWLLNHLVIEVIYFFITDKKSITGKRKDYWEYFCECLGPLKGVNDGIKYVKTTGDVSIDYNKK